MNLSQYPNLCKAEKIKSTLRILLKGFYLVYLTHQIMTQIVERMCTVKFLIASDWRLPVIVTRPNVFRIWFLGISSMNFIV